MKLTADSISDTDFMVTGKEPIYEFAIYVHNFLENGGSRTISITAEVFEIVKNHNQK